MLSIIWLGLTGYLLIQVPWASGMQNASSCPIEIFQPKPGFNGGGPGPQVSGCEKSCMDGNLLQMDTATFLAENTSKSSGIQKSANKITGIRFEALYSGEEKVIISGTGISPPLIFALEGEKPRVVCDFKGTDLGSGVASKINTNGKFIKMIRTGLYKDEGGKVRVVLDLSPEKSYEVEQTFYKNQHTYELIIKPEKPIL